MPFHAVCTNPKCGRPCVIPDATAGWPVRCIHCSQTFIAGESVTIESPGPAKPAPPPSSPALRSTIGLVPASSPQLKPTPPPATTTAPVPAPTAVPNSQNIGTLFGRFQIRGKLGVGAFGTVYRAFDPILKRDVALKVPNPGVMSDSKRVERFLREAKSAAQLRHPHIVPVFDAGQDGDRYYIASAFIDGEQLGESIPENGTDFTRAARLARELAEALAYAHEQGIVHRDVKPANVMVDRYGRSHLMDFGLASRQAEEARITNDGAIMGTPAYMAPEQAAGQQGEAHPATDQYAVGVVLYELLTGRTPFTGPPAVVLHNVLHTEPEPPRKHRPDVPRDLETICLKAMAKRPQDRYPDCQGLADDLRRWMEHEPISARKLNPWERFTRWVKKEPKLAAALGLIATLLLVGVWLLQTSTRRARETAEMHELRLKADEAAKRAEREAAEAREAEARANTEAARANTEAARANTEAGKARKAQEAEAEERKKTAAALEEVRKEKETALEAEQRARSAEADAKLARAEAEADSDAAKKALGKLQATTYPTHVVLAATLIDREKPYDARDALNRCHESVRGWEWHHLSRVCNKEPLVEKVITASAPSCAAFSATGRWLAVSQSDEVTKLFQITRNTPFPAVSLPFARSWECPPGAQYRVPGAAVQIWPAKTVRVSYDGELVAAVFEKHTALFRREPVGATLSSEVIPDFRYVEFVTTDLVKGLRSFQGLGYTESPDARTAKTLRTTTPTDRQAELDAALVSISGRAVTFHTAAGGRWLATTSGDLYELDWSVVGDATRIGDPLMKRLGKNFLAACATHYGLNKTETQLWALAVAPNDKQVVFSEIWSDSVYLYRPGLKNEEFKKVPGTWRGVEQFRFSVDGNRLAFLAGGGVEVDARGAAVGRRDPRPSIHIVDTLTGGYLCRVSPETEILDFAFHADTGELMVITRNGELRVYRGK